MSSLEEIEAFLQDFRVKYKVFDIIFRDGREKNADTLFKLDITRVQRREIIEAIIATDYVEGPLDDRLYGIASMWVFGKRYKQTELYIKISLGAPNSNVICISFHQAERTMRYPYRRH
ncbi:toxin [Pararcticibacter amylolyticus]|uniref:Toxin n=1 Tax=Pararcticibacter amylolyticus TaxID=2173175 RepID=A0A2U2PD24_9SPHI|nr:toxin [Pararcticibacter amylolyticus]PWG79301.1 toxin [Pararcticibacter amylolyticus]